MTTDLSGARSDHFDALVTASDDAILSKDRQGIILSWNPAAERMYGYSPEEAVGSHVSILIPEHRAGEEQRILDRVLAGERISHYETERVRKDGRQISVSLSVSPIRDEKGTVVSAAVIARDVTALLRSRELAERLQAVTSALSKELTPRRALDVLLQEAVSGLKADAGAIGLVEQERGEIVLTGSWGYSEAGLAGWQSFPVEADVPMSHAVRTGQQVWVEGRTELRQRFPGLASIEEESFRFDSLAVIPLTVEGKSFGAISLSFKHARPFDAEERAFLNAAAQQAAYALDRARLYEAERRAAERLAFLAEASSLLSVSLDVDTNLNNLAQLAVGRIADWCGVDLVGDDGEIRQVAVAHVDPAQVEFARQLRRRYPAEPDATQGVPMVIRTGHSELYPRLTDEQLELSARDQEHLELIRRLELRSAMIVPLRARGKVLGAISFVSSRPERHYGPEDLRLAEDFAHRAALAVDNSMLFRREHEAAVTLQRSLLPQALPAPDGIEFATRYHPAGAGLHVGGDWYEAVRLDDGSVAVTIGDVAGHGIRAAAVMGRLRQALRAYVRDGHGPAEAIARLDRLMRDDSESPEMATVLHLRYDPGSGMARYIRAGHPPGLARLPSGEVIRLDGAGTPPLGILHEVEYRPHTVELPPGSLLLLYTDGLIERRNEDFETALQRLSALLAESPDGAQSCIEWITAEVSPDTMPDDVALLVMKVC